MADDGQVIRGIDWRATFPATHLFRAFRIAMHPSKLVLGLLLVGMVYAGGSVLDLAWPKEYRAVPGEINLYALTHGLRQGELVISGKMTPFLDETRLDEPQHYEATRQGLFGAMFEFEVHQVTSVAHAVLGGAWFGGENGGVIGGLYNFIVVAPLWLLHNHPVFLLIFFVWFLIAWAVFGGAIARIAAVHVARDEKISIRQAMNFAVAKFPAYLFAPLIPLIIICLLGGFLTVCSLLGNIPYIGPIVVGALFFVALILGLIITLVLIGAIGGFNLMYPTIAVEGSDSFDAISRSFSYVYGRPWRMMFYTAVAIAYGAITYLFVHMFILLLLSLTHYFVGLGIFTHDSAGQGLLDSMWPNPWVSGQFYYKPDYEHLNVGGKIGAALLQVWVKLPVFLLGGFAVSLFFSANTIVYYLMRHEVDATELDDVYLEQTDEELGEASDDAEAEVEPPAPDAAAPAPPTSAPSSAG